MIELFHDIDFEYLESDNSLVIYNDSHQMEVPLYGQVRQ